MGALEADGKRKRKSLLLIVGSSKACETLEGNATVTLIRHVDSCPWQSLGYESYIRLVSHHST